MFTILARTAAAIALTVTTAVSSPSSNTPPTQYPDPSPVVLGESATNANQTEPIQPTINQLRAETLTRYLAKHNSPLEPHAQDFIDAAKAHNLEWHLLPSIAGVESTFGKFLPQNSYNPFGWASAKIHFNGWQDGIFTVAEGIERIYYNRGRNTPELMHKVYAPPSPDWGQKVRFFMNKIEAEHQTTLDSYGISDESPDNAVK